MKNQKKIIIASDHRGYKLKELIKQQLGYETIMVDVGCSSEDSVNYPSIAQSLINSMREDINNSIGIIICGSGVGVSMAVNKAQDIRGALVFNEGVAQSSREHNNANIICLAADYISLEQAIKFINIFITTEFLGDRHQKRVDMLNNIK